MNKLHAENVSIEITRRCNMTCAHCMRGDAEDTDIDHRHIRNLLQHLRRIRRFNITGGEPSLNPRAIRYILKQLKSFDIRVEDFYIVTNGSLSSISQSFIDACSALYAYQEDKDQNEFHHMLEMSDDRFHDSRNREEVTTVLNRYPFFGMRGQDRNIFLLKEGRCGKGYPNPVQPIFLTKENEICGDVYLNARGEILSNGNLSYLRQKDNVLCRSSCFLQYIKTTLKKFLYE